MKWFLIFILAFLAWVFYSSYSQAQAALKKTGGVGPL